MKYLLLFAILAVVVLVFFGRGRSRIEPPKPPSSPPTKPPLVQTEIVACAHCGVHLPEAEAVFDTARRPYCTPEHRVAGPR